MKRYSKKTISSIQLLRKKGKTYPEIQKSLKLSICKSVLSYWCRNITLPSDYPDRITQQHIMDLAKARHNATKVKLENRKLLFDKLTNINQEIALKIHNHDIGKIALSMLCLGEASKYNPKTTSTFYLGSSNNKIITIFLKLLSTFKTFDKTKIRCTVQCRSDQNTEVLQQYWMKITNVPSSQFYKPLIDPRTKGKPTLNINYMGVLRVDYFDRKIQLELESLAELIYNQLVNK